MLLIVAAVSVVVVVVEVAVVVVVAAVAVVLVVALIVLIHLYDHRCDPRCVHRYDRRRHHPRR